MISIKMGNRSLWGAVGRSGETSSITNVRLR